MSDHSLMFSSRAEGSIHLGVPKPPGDSESVGEIEGFAVNFEWGRDYECRDGHVIKYGNMNLFHYRVRFILTQGIKHELLAMDSGGEWHEVASHMERGC